MPANECDPTPLIFDRRTLTRRRDARSSASSQQVAPLECSFTVHVGLGHVGGRRDQIRAEIGDQLDDYRIVTRQDPDGQLILTLTVPAADLWLSVLMGMAAVARTGYSARSVEAMRTTAIA